MLNKVGQDDVASYKNDNEWLKFHPKDSRFFARLDEIWAQLELVMVGRFFFRLFAFKTV